METIMIHKLGSTKFTTQIDLYEKYRRKREEILIGTKFIDYDLMRAARVPWHVLRPGLRAEQAPAQGLGRVPLPHKFEGYAAKFAPHEALKIIA